ncbi:MAG: glycosyltransferase family 4 protein [Geobacteraceae bacterium]|nr:glycosyltransferase family 4 protein [Geobacteraceae bacterium]
MKICFLAHGNFTHIATYLEYFKNRGHEVVFVRLADGPIPEGIQLYDSFRGFPSFFPGKISYLFSILKSKWFIQNYKPTVINAHYATSGGLAAILSGYQPYVITAHGTDLISNYKNTIWRFLLSRILSRSSKVVVVSEQLYEIATELIGSSENINTISVGIDTDMYKIKCKKYNRDSEPLRLISTRRAESVYDPDCIIDALVILANNGLNFEMTFVGGGPLLDTIINKSELTGVRKYINFVGQMEKHLIPNLLIGHHVYISASKWDGASLSLFEAMAAGLFPIVTDIIANRSFINNEENGLLYEVGNPADLACSIEKFANSSTEFHYQDINFSLVKDKGDVNKNMLKLEQIFKSFSVDD